MEGDLALTRVVVLFLVVVGLMACGGPEELDAEGISVETLAVEGRSFGTPPTVAAGESFAIDNRDATRHTFTSADNAWPR